MSGLNFMAIYLIVVTISHQNTICQLHVAEESQRITKAGFALGCGDLVINKSLPCQCMRCCSCTLGTSFPPTHKIQSLYLSSFMAPKNQDGDSQNAKIEASEHKSTNTWVTSQWLHPLFLYSLRLNVIQMTCIKT